MDNMTEAAGDGCIRKAQSAGCRPADGKRKTGFVFTIDATLALSLLLIILATTVFLSIQAAEDPYGKLQVARAGRDMLAVMDIQGVLSSGNNTTIQAAMGSVLPGGLGAHLQVSSYYYSNGSNSFNYLNATEYGENIPGNRTTHGARLDFVTMKNGQIVNYSIARAWIWQR